MTMTDVERLQRALEIRAEFLDSLGRRDEAAQVRAERDEVESSGVEQAKPIQNIEEIRQVLSETLAAENGIQTALRRILEGTLAEKSAKPAEGTLVEKSAKPAEGTFVEKVKRPEGAIVEKANAAGRAVPKTGESEARDRRDQIK